MKLLRLIDYPIFVGLIMYKLFLFGDIIEMPITSYNNRIMVSIGGVILVSFWVLFLNYRVRLIALLLLNIVISGIIISDLVYFRYFNAFITIPVLQQAKQVGGIMSSILDLIKKNDILFILDILILGPILIFIFKKIPKNKFAFSFSNVIRRIAMVAIMFTIGYQLMAIPINQYLERYEAGVFQKNYSNLTMYRIIGLLGFHGFDSYRYVMDSVLYKKSLSPEDKEEIMHWFKENNKQRSVETEFYGAAKGKNVLIFQMESFQNFMIGKEINGKEITPNLNKLLKNSMYFSQIYDQTGEGRTSDADMMLNTSFLPLPAGSAYVRFPNNSYEGLPTIVKEKGYSTFAFHGNNKSFWNRHIMYPVLGYDKFYGLEDLKFDDNLGYFLSDRSLIRQSLAVLKEAEDPFFAYLIGVTSHHPFNYRQKDVTLNIGEYEGTSFGRYLHSVNYVDTQMGYLIEEMKATGLWDNTVIMIYGDHDAGKMVEEGGLASFLNESEDSFAFEKVRNQIPLFIHLPEDIGKGTYTNVGGQYDFGPTLLHLLGIPSEDKYLMGTNLLNPSHNLVVIRNGTFTDGKIYYKAPLEGEFEKGTCYDLSTSNELPVNNCKAVAIEARNKQDLSDRFFYGDLLKQLKDKK